MLSVKFILNHITFQSFFINSATLFSFQIFVVIFLQSPGFDSEQVILLTEQTALQVGINTAVYLNL